MSRSGRCRLVLRRCVLEGVRGGGGAVKRLIRTVFWCYCQTQIVNSTKKHIFNRVRQKKHKMQCILFSYLDMFGFHLSGAFLPIDSKNGVKKGEKNILQVATGILVGQVS